MAKRSWESPASGVKTMTIDPKIKEAIKTAVTESGQPEGLARKLDSWFEAIATGNEDINDKQSAHRHLELLYEKVQLNADATSNEKEGF